MNVVRITEVEEHDVIAALEYLLNAARRGRIRGLLFAFKVAGSSDHRYGFAGQYWQDPMTTLAVAARVSYCINQVIDSRNSSSPETDSMPL